LAGRNQKSIQLPNGSDYILIIKTLLLQEPSVMCIAEVKFFNIDARGHNNVHAHANDNAKHHPHVGHYDLSWINIHLNAYLASFFFVENWIKVSESLEEEHIHCSESEGNQDENDHVEVEASFLDVVSLLCHLVF
jgi:hypothetical protein